MEFLLLGLFGFMAVIGGLVGFFSLFGKGKDASRFSELETTVQTLKNRLNAVEKQLNDANKQTELKQSVDVATESKTTESIVTETKLNAAPKAQQTVHVEATVNKAVQEPKPAVATERSAASSHVPEKPEPKTTEPWPTTQQYKSPEPNFIDRGIDFAKDWLFGGNTLVRSGIVILFIGIAFLLKFAVDNNFISIELRLSAVLLFGIALLVTGWRLREKRAQYAWALQGGGIGVLYLTIFAAMKLYSLIPPSAAFVLLAMVAFLSAALAVLQSALPLAILGFMGGFLAPIFTSTGNGSHVGLFSYYLVLNLAIAFIAFHKSWRSLNVMGFAFTFIIGTLWGAKAYIPEHFSTTEPFLIIHFLLFTLIAVLYAHRQSTKVRDYVDATLVFGTPIVGFSLQYALLKDVPFGMAYSALALGIFYISLAWWLFTRKQDTLQFLGECFLALGVGFATLTLPLALDGRWTSAAWAVEGVGLLWVGLRQNRVFPQFAGLALQLLAAMAFVYGWGLTGSAG